MTHEDSPTESENGYKFDEFDPFLVTLKSNKSFSDTKLIPLDKNELNNKVMNRSDSIDNNYFGFGTFVLSPKEKRITKTRSETNISHSGTLDLKSRPTDETKFYLIEEKDQGSDRSSDNVVTPTRCSLKHVSPASTKGNNPSEKNKFLSSPTGDKYLLSKNFQSMNLHFGWSGLSVRFMEYMLRYLNGIEINYIRHVNKLWYENVNYILMDRCDEIISRFTEVYKDYMEYKSCYLLFNPILTSIKSVKIDLYIRAKIGYKCSLHGNNFSYTFNYNKDSSVFINKFTFDVLKKGTKRVVSLIRDTSTTCNNDFNYSNYTTPVQLNEGDFIDIPITLINAIGVTDTHTLQFLPLTQNKLNNNLNNIDTLHREWYNVEHNSQYLKQLFPQNITNYTFVQHELLKPQLLHQSTLVAGVDVVTFKLNYIANDIGMIDESVDFLGHSLEVVDRDGPITCMIERIGIQYDHKCHVQLRSGDVLQLYLTSG